MAKRGDLKGYQGLKRLSVDEIIKQSDAVLVETDVWNLTEIAQKCIDAGKHIHMDKPASGTLEEYKHLLDSAKAQNLIVQLAYMYRYNPAVQKCFELIKDGKTFRSAILSAQNGWQFEFSDVPKDAWYSIYEETDGKYAVSYSGNAADGYVITNTYPTDTPKNEQPEPTNPTLTDIPVYKMWNDSENAAGERPQSITVHLIRNGSLYRSLTLSAYDGWKGVFTDVPADGAYSITEDAVLGYTAHYTVGSVFVVTNTYTEGETNPGTPPEPFVPSTDGTTSSASDGFYEETVSIPQTGSLN